VSLPIGVDINGRSSNSLEYFRQWAAQNPTPAEARHFLRDIYRRFPIDAAPQYRQAFAALVDGKTPALTHCSAGKDRTGTFSAILLVALGVPLETALRDYALTNQYLPLDQQTIARASKLVPPTFDPQSLHVLMAADPQYARAAFESIDEKFGSFKNYRRTALDLSDSSLAELKTNLLQA
jgi:protein-tyrosine phosphatase